jgi:L-alanine-DL-glutamate epimerase-like enolase superfamily enzyme
VKIVRLEVFPVSVPHKTKYQLSLGSTDISRNVIIKLYTDAGIVGLGEASTGTLPDRTGETQEGIVFMLTRYFGPRLIGKDPFALEAILHDLDRVAFGKYAGLYSKCAVDFACHDIMGKACNVPVYQLIGGQIRSEVGVSRSLPVGKPPSEFAKDVLSRRDEGYKMLTVKGTADVDYDVACFRAAREALGPGFPLEIDPNQAWTSANAIRTIHRLEEYDLAGAEQPLPWWDYDGMIALTKAVDTPIMADETVLSISEAYQVAHRGMANLITLKLPKNGGLFMSKQIAAIAEAAGLECNMGSRHPLGVGTAALHHFACSTTAVTDTIGYGSPLERLVDDVITEPIPFERGVARPPAGPGLGVELDEKKMQKYAVKIVADV